jgi:hypothetical protein
MWCRRLDADTFADSRVQGELNQLVALRLDAEKSGADLAGRFGVNSYPTVIFTDADGTEIERISGYLPPDGFVEEVQRIRAGDTFAAWLETLAEDPGDAEALQRAVAGFLERSDPEGALVRIDAFREAAGESGEALARQLLLEARIALHDRHYTLAAKLYHKGWPRNLEIADSGAQHLRDLLEEGLSELDEAEQAERLREARRADAAEILEDVAVAEIPAAELFPVATFAYRSGLVADSARLYARWYTAVGDGADPGALNGAAWNLYLAGEDLGRALVMARQAYADDPSPSVGDTLARLLYVTGSARDAIAIQRRAASAAENGEAVEYRAVVEKMEGGEPLGDEPGFLAYPG